MYCFDTQRKILLLITLSRDQKQMTSKSSALFSITTGQKETLANF